MAVLLKKLPLATLVCVVPEQSNGIIVCCIQMYIYGTNQSLEKFLNEISVGNCETV
jgi:hypothetical protein